MIETFDWQKRALQAVADNNKAEQEAERIKAEEQAKHDKRLANDMRTLLAQHGIDVPSDAEKPEVELEGGYTIKYSEEEIYADQWSNNEEVAHAFRLTIIKAIPNADASITNNLYRTEISADIGWKKRGTLATFSIGHTILELEKRAPEFVQRNSDIEANLSKPDPKPTEPTLTLSDAEKALILAFRALNGA